MIIAMGFTRDTKVRSHMRAIYLAAPMSIGSASYQNMDLDILEAIDDYRLHIVGQ
jgi:hypothetical protein